MAESLTAARPYAKALYEVASADKLDQWLPVMEAYKVMGESDITRRFLSSSDITLEKFQKVVSSVFDNVGITQLPAKYDDFLGVIAKNKRFALLPEIAELFVDEVNKSNDTVIAKIISAKALGDDDKNKLVDKLEARYGKKVEAIIEIDKSLIGGAVIRVGDTVIDGSIRGRLEEFTKALS